MRRRDREEPIAVQRARQRRRACNTPAAAYMESGVGCSAPLPAMDTNTAMHHKSIASVNFAKLCVGRHPARVDLDPKSLPLRARGHASPETSSSSRPTGFRLARTNHGPAAAGFGLPIYTVARQGPQAAPARLQRRQRSRPRIAPRRSTQASRGWCWCARAPPRAQGGTALMGMRILRGGLSRGVP